MLCLYSGLYIKAISYNFYSNYSYFYMFLFLHKIKITLSNIILSKEPTHPETILSNAPIPFDENYMNIYEEGQQVYILNYFYMTGDIFSIVPMRFNDSIIIASVIILSSDFNLSSNLIASLCHWSFSTINAIKYDASTNIKLSPFQSF